MAERLLKKKAHKVTPKKSQVKESTDAVIVGTYKAKQLAWIKRHGIYNYPVREEDLATKNSRTCRKLRKTMGAAVDAPCEILVCRRSRCAHMHNLLYCPQFAIQTGKTPE